MSDLQRNRVSNLWPLGPEAEHQQRSHHGPSKMFEIKVFIVFNYLVKKPNLKKSCKESDIFMQVLKHPRRNGGSIIINIMADLRRNMGSIIINIMADLRRNGGSIIINIMADLRRNGGSIIINIMADLRRNL
ncbi:hypothetical protein AVEN_146860-1 [Araneus ventricosus]|uniref:Uncharacterized protein n=1 Tax=Araneus ventricosus TaxID=182803 RepID=A0A4Y2R735_ARAVE|nr:hypothetical protein AVEN_146860-1 [Araneus ventricosus]